MEKEKTYEHSISLTMIKAIQYTGSNLDSCVAFLDSGKHPIKSYILKRNSLAQYPLELLTYYGVVSVAPNDWIIRNGGGDYDCFSDDFFKKYFTEKDHE